jgi:hypothetical protein
MADRARLALDLDLVLVRVDDTGGVAVGQRCSRQRQQHHLRNDLQTCSCQWANPSDERRQRCQQQQQQQQ